jgi:tetratricopeptide (TPR) repeat protein
MSPRSTLVRNLRPEIRWAPIAGAKTVTYRVTIYTESMRAVWSREVDSKTTLAYPEKEPALAPGRVYKVIVTAQGRSSEEENLPDLGFVTLTAEQSRAVERDEQKRKQLGLSEVTTRILIANLYAARELYAEANEQLERAHDAAKDAVVARKLGDLYMRVGLNREAEKKYIEALKLLDPEDLEETGVTQKNLATACEQLGIFDQAVARLEEAIKAYEQLGDSAAVEELRKQEQRLNRK